MSLLLIPVTLREANGFVEQYHTHHHSTVGHRWSVGVARNGKLVGVAICGRPSARMIDRHKVCEALRVCTNQGISARNACSKLYSACARAAEAMGYCEIITYILQSEDGTSLRASGWECVGSSAGGSWSRPSRKRQDDHPLEPKVKWRKLLR